MLDNTGYGFGTSAARRGSGNVFTHTLMAILGAAIATGLFLAFYNPAPAALAKPCREAARCLPRVPRPPR